MEYSSVVGISVANVVVSGSSGSVIGEVQVGVEKSSVKTGSIIINCVVSSVSVGISLVAYTSVVNNSGGIVVSIKVTGTVGDSVDDVAGDSVDIDIGCSVDEVVFDDIVVTFDVDDVDDEKLSVVRDAVGDAVDFVVGDCVDAAVDCSVDDVVTVEVSGAEVPVVTLIADEDTSVLVLSSVVV